MVDRDTFNRELIAEFRANGGRVSGQFAGAPLLLLTTSGAKSGLPHNLLANPEVTVELPSETFRARATVPQGAERDRLFDQMAAQMPGFADYQRNTARRLPVVVLERVA